MRDDGRRSLPRLLLALLAGGDWRLAQQQPQHRSINALNWAFGGTVHTVARAGSRGVRGRTLQRRRVRHARHRRVRGDFGGHEPSGVAHRARARQRQRDRRRRRRRLVRGRQLHVRGTRAPAADCASSWPMAASTRRGPAGSNGRVWRSRSSARRCTSAASSRTPAAASAAGCPKPRANFAAFAAADGALLPAAAAGADASVLRARRRRLHALHRAATSRRLPAPRGAPGRLRHVVRRRDRLEPLGGRSVRAIVPAGGRLHALRRRGVCHRRRRRPRAVPRADRRGHRPGDVLGTRAPMTPFRRWRFGRHALRRRRVHAARRQRAQSRRRRAPHHRCCVCLGSQRRRSSCSRLSIAGVGIYLGGEFLNVGGPVRLHAAAVDRRDRARSTAWHPALNDPVRAMVVAWPTAWRSAGRSKRSAPIVAGTSRPSISRPASCCRGGRIPTARCSRSTWRAIAGSTSAGCSRQSPARRAPGSRRSICRRTAWPRGTPGPMAPCSRSPVHRRSGVTTVYAGGDFATAGGAAGAIWRRLGRERRWPLPGFVPGTTDDDVLALDVGCHTRLRRWPLHVPRRLRSRLSRARQPHDGCR